MDYLTVEGVMPYDGKYEFDLRDRPFTVREWGWIKRYSGYLPLTLFDGWKASDAELMAVFAIISLARAGKVANDDVPQAWERFSDRPGVATVRIELDTEDADASPPTPPESSSKNGSFSGDGSTTSSEPSEPALPATGTPASATSASLPVT